MWRQRYIHTIANFRPHLKSPPWETTMNPKCADAASLLSFFKRIQKLKREYMEFLAEWCSRTPKYDILEEKLELESCLYRRESLPFFLCHTFLMSPHRDWAPCDLTERRQLRLFFLFFFSSCSFICVVIKSEILHSWRAKNNLRRRLVFVFL